MAPGIYFDNAATTKVDEKVVEAMLPYFTKHYGNASSQHTKGIDAKSALEKSRRVIAKSINANTDEIIFTSGGTEGNNLALKGLFFQNYPEKDHIVTTKIEHECIMNTCKWLEKKGAKVTYLDVDKEGFINMEDLKNAINKKTIVVSVIHGNNEIGTIQDIKKIGEICHEKNTLFHTDACQSHTKTDINVKKQNVDLMTLNSHKIHGPKGAGALYVKQGIKLNAILHGGGQEKKIRSGTENIPGIIGFAKAVDSASNKYVKQMTKQRDRIIKELLKIKDVTLNGPKIERLCNNINVSFSDIEGEAIGGQLEDLGIYTSTGSACMSSTLSTSHVLKALGHSKLKSNSSLRISISKYTTDKEIDYFLNNISKIVEKLRKISPINNTGDWI